MKTIQSQLREITNTKAIVRILAPDIKKTMLEGLAQKVLDFQGDILAANQADVEKYQNSSHFQPALLDRLVLNKIRLQQMIDSLKQVAALPDPVGQEVGAKELMNGLRLRQVRSPLGLIFMIFEARPNVITEAFSLAFKSGNALIMKGGKESENTSRVLYDLIEQSLREVGLPSQLFWGLLGVSREVTDFLMKQDKSIDVLIPRGGEKLIEYVSENSTIPIIKNDRGLCHLYVHQDANESMALKILENAKTQRPSVCNAVETLLIDEPLAASFLRLMHSQLHAKNVSFFVCSKSFEFLSGRAGVSLAQASSFDTEYLDLKLNVRVVAGLDEAMKHIELHGSRHSEAIVTENRKVAEAFQAGIDAAAVYWNASTRFTDGGQFGLGAEIGISTQKLHVRGPVGLDALTSIRWLIDGEGQVRA